MKSKLIALTLFVMALLLPADRTCEPLALQRDCDRQLDKCDGAAGQVIKLDLKGSRGVVCFIHKTHETYLNQDTGFPHRAEKGAECIGCHHKRSEATGVPILWKCTSCHGSAGNSGNPKNTDSDEVWRERAFHELCIGCHRASNNKGVAKCKAPVACSECHQSKSGVAEKPISGMQSSIESLN